MHTSTCSEFQPVFDTFFRDLGHPALFAENGQTITNGELVAACAAWHEALTTLGITETHRLATVLENGATALIGFLALADKTSVMPMNPATNPAVLVRRVNNADVDAVLVGASPTFDRIATRLEKQGVAVIRLRGTPLAPHLEGAVLPASKGQTGPRFILHTSGSTGEPKRVALRPEQLLLSARNIATHLALGPQDTAVHALPMFHIGAVVDLFLAPLVAGGSVVVSPGLEAAHIVKAVLDHRATWLQLVPTALRHLLDVESGETGIAMGRSLRFVRMVSADLPETLRLEAESFFADTPVIQMYGMTETAGQIASMPLPPGARLANSVGRPIGVEVAIIDHHGAVVETGREGEVCVRGATVMDGYEGAARIPRHADWLRTGDLGRFDETGNLFLTGRAKEIINRGGEKISPVFIERATKAISGVKEAVAFALPHPTLGEQVGLAVVAPGLAEEDVLGGLAERIAEFEMPRRVFFFDVLPRLPGGKVDRRAIAAETRQEEQETEAPGGLASDVAQVWATTLKTRLPHAESDFFDDGGDSLSATDFLLSLEKILGQSLPPNLLFEAPRFSALVEHLGQSLGEARSNDDRPYLEFLRNRTAGWRGQRVGPRKIIVARNTIRPHKKIFFGANGNAIANVFGNRFASGHPLYLLRTLVDYSEGFRNLTPDLARTYADEISSLLSPGESVLFCGFCGGANLMEEIAPLLIARGHPVELFIAIDKVFHKPTDYPVFYIWSDDEKFAGGKRYLDPRRRFADLHPKGADYLLLDTHHVAIVSKKTVPVIAARILPLLEGAALPKPTLPAGHKAMTHEQHVERARADIRMFCNPLVLNRKSHRVRVRVTNTSSVAWEPTDESGLFLSTAFIRRDESCANEGKTFFKLEETVPPGGTFRADLRVELPAYGRRFQLSAHMVDDGYGAFYDIGTGQALKPIFSPFGKVPPKPQPPSANGARSEPGS